MKRVCMVILALVSGTMIYAIKDNLQFLQVQLGDLKKELDVLQDNLSKVKTEPKQRRRAMK
jgi:hypothetical protein